MLWVGRRTARPETFGMDGFRLHTFTLLSLDGFVDVALEPWVFPCWWDLWFMLFLLAPSALATGCTQRSGNTLRSIVRSGHVPPTPFTHYGPGSSFLYWSDVPNYLF